MADVGLGVTAGDIVGPGGTGGVVGIAGMVGAAGGVGTGGVVGIGGVVGADGGVACSAGVSVTAAAELGANDNPATSKQARVRIVRMYATSRSAFGSRVPAENQVL